MQPNEKLSKFLTTLHLKQVQDFENLIKLIEALDIKDKELSDKLEAVKDGNLRILLNDRDIQVITDSVLSLIPPVDKDKIIQDVLKQIPPPKVIEKKPIQIFPRESLDVDKVAQEVLKKVPLPEPLEQFKLTEKEVGELIVFLENRKGEARLDAKAIKNLEENIDPGKLKIPAPTIVNRYHATEFRRLIDTPDSYEGHAGKVVKVKADEQGLEFGEGADLSGYVPYNDANQDILPTDDTVSLGSLISEKRFKHLHTSGVKVESEFTSTGEASAFGFTLSAVIGQTIGVTEELSNGVLTFGRTTTGNVQHAGSRVWLHTLNPVFYSIQRFNSITDNQHIWGFMTTGTDISDIQGIYFAKLTGETNIQARVRDGAGTQTTDTGVAVADATMQEFLIQVTNGRARFYINGVEVADISSNVPTAHLKWLWRIETSDTGTKTFGLDYAKIYQNRT